MTELQKQVSAEKLAAKAAPATVRKELEELTQRLRGLQAELKEVLKSFLASKEVKEEPFSSKAPFLEVKS